MPSRESDAIALRRRAAARTIPSWRTPCANVSRTSLWTKCKKRRRRSAPCSTRSTERRLRGVSFAGDAQRGDEPLRGCASRRRARRRTAHTMTAHARLPRQAGKSRCIARRRSPTKRHTLRARTTKRSSAACRPERSPCCSGAAPTCRSISTRLLERDIPAAAAGDVNVFADRRALDALALLWNVWDPFRHEWLLRTLSGQGTGALGCVDRRALRRSARSAGRALRARPRTSADRRERSRWDPKRDVRLGWNVLRGETDHFAQRRRARAHLALRELREGWVQRDDRTSARRVRAQGLVGRAARRRRRRARRARAPSSISCVTCCDRLLDAATRAPERDARRSLADIAERAESDCEACDAAARSGDSCKCSASMRPAGARSHSSRSPTRAPVRFRAGTFPMPFLWSPTLGMIPRENAGAARASRTAKFSYYLYRTKAREAYNAQERCAFEYATFARARHGTGHGVRLADARHYGARISRRAAQRAMNLRAHRFRHVRGRSTSAHAPSCGRDGRTRSRYVAQTGEIARCGYGRRHYRTVGLYEESTCSRRSSATSARCASARERLRAIGIGAVFTPPELRGRGYASAMLAMELDRSRAEGVDLAFLFSDIRPEFYAELGFVAMPSRSMSFACRQLADARASRLRDSTIATGSAYSVASTRASGIAAGPSCERRWCGSGFVCACAMDPSIPKASRRTWSCGAGAPLPHTCSARAPHNTMPIFSTSSALPTPRRDALIPALLRSAAGDLRRVTGWLPAGIDARHACPASRCVSARRPCSWLRLCSARRQSNG